MTKKHFKIETHGKLLFLILSTISLIMLMAITTVIWWLIKEALGEIHTILRESTWKSLYVFYGVVILGIMMLFLQCYTPLKIKIFQKLVRFTITLLFPINVFIGKCVFIPMDKIRESFVKVNNAFIKIGKQKYSEKEILILLPHCLQNYDCLYRITNNIENCIECDKCNIKTLKNIAQKYNTKIAIATGGTLARKIIVQTKPKCIIAVACQKDLVDGLLEVYPIPVYGILNKRPNGPCISTQVDTNEIEQFLQNIIKKEAVV